MKYWLYFFITTTIVSLITIAGMIFVGLEYKAAQENLHTQGTEYKNFIHAEKVSLEKEVALLQSETEDLSDDLRREERKYDKLSDEIGGAIETVTTLAKLETIDEELLQKYSKVYFLNEHYNPNKLKDINSDYLYSDKQLQVKSEVALFLEDLLKDAERDDIDLRILSAYRSFGTQAAIKHHYVVTYGTTAANTFSADQGYSEHQLGTTIDFTTPENGSDLSLFKNTEEFEWLQDNAYKHGFTLSYPEGNQYYVSEPWHWRFVGKDLARDLQKEEEYFYDRDQRDLNKFLISIFED